ncbi:MAG: hypothetical protein WKG01_14850 [Kofleriaceae bacterium]
MNRALAVLCLLTGVAHADSTAKLVERARLEIQPAGGRAIKQLTIDNPLGDVRVEGHDGATIQIESRKQGPDEEALDRLRISLVPNPDGTVRITTTADGGKEYKPLARGAVRIDLIIRAPRNARVEAAASSGALEVVNMDAGGDLDTASGKIDVRNVQGELSTHSVSGRTKLTQVFGSVDAQTLSSDLDLDTISGERLLATATKGKIAGRRIRSRHVELTTTDGKISFEGEAALRGRMILASMKGDIDVRLRRNGALVVRARGVKVDLGTAVKALTDGWVESQLGSLQRGEAPSIVELRSHRGIVRFAIAQ